MNNFIVNAEALQLLERLESGSAGLVYLDPPWPAASLTFLAEQSYLDISGRKVRHEKKDTLPEYLEWLSHIFQESKRVCSAQGSVVLHVPPRVGSYARVMAERLFFAENVSEIVVSTRRFQLPKSTADNHESLLFCRASKDSVTNEIYITPSASELKARFSYRDMRGQFGIRDITGPFRPALSYPVNGIMPPAGRSWRFTKERFDALVAENRIYYSPKTNRPFLKSYAEEFLGVPAGTTWTDISMHLARSERCGYPAQQPLALMERIVQRATNVEDIVVDPFMGSGTTLAAAANFNRQWIGCDNNPDAISICEERMRGVLAASKEIVVPTAEFLEKPVSISRYSRLTHGLFDAEAGLPFCPR
jgi:DNA modification methylase